MKDSATEEEPKSKIKEDSCSQQDLTKDIIYKNETTVVDSEALNSQLVINNCSSSNEVIVENIDQVVPSNLTVLDSVDSVSVEPTIKTSETVDHSESILQKEFTSIIEISGDGTWNTAKIPLSHIETSRNSESNVMTESLDQDFLTSSPDTRAKHVNLAYSGQYYCPVASIKPMKHTDDITSEAKKNIGAQIMEKYEEEKKKLIESKNLPDVSLLDVDESLEEIQKERRKIIESQAVRAKRIDSWIKGGPITLDENGVPVKYDSSPDCEVSASSQEDSVNTYLDENGEVVYDSIIQNKSKIKSYWEQLMLAAELATQQTSTKVSHQHNYTPPPPPPAAPAPVHHVVSEKVHSPDLSEAEYFDALSHVSAIQTPDPEKDGVTETVVERDIRIQQERELALMIERQKALKNAGAKMKEKDADEAYLSIPTTDEGNFSEYGSEDKEDHSPDGSRVTSPAVMGSHHRTQSLDSMSSGHSSGSGTVSHPDLSLTKPDRRQTFGPVKPLDEPDDSDILTYVKYDKETPIEREIRLAREREEELRREKRIAATPLRPETEKKKDVSPRVTVSPATQRVQQEIELASEREKELKRWTSDDLHKDVSTKVVLKPTARKANPSPIVQNRDVNKETMDVSKTPKTGGASPKIYIPNPQQKGLMKRFLASRGKMGSSPRLNSLTSPTSATLPPLKTPSLSPNSLLSEPFFSFTSLVQSKEREEPLNLGARPGYKSAEHKIQSELREMKRREEELRQQRRSNLYSARSQPDLLNIINDPMSEREVSLADEEPARLPNNSKLRSALSVQNLLDVDEKPAPRRLPKRKSALIEQWESRIQNKN